MMRGACGCVVLLLAGCSGILGIEDLAPSTIHGTARDLLANPVEQVNIVLHLDPDGVRVSHAVTDDDGKFELPITAALPVTGYFEIMDPRYVHTRSHLVDFVVEHADLDVEIFTVTPDGLRSIVARAGRTQRAASWLVIAKVIDDDGGSFASATVGAQVGDPPQPVQQICYADPQTSLPCGDGSSTEADGLAFLFDVPEADSLAITAMNGPGKRVDAELPIPAGPGLLFTPVPIPRRAP
jgi:hypothetical protein